MFVVTVEVPESVVVKDNVVSVVDDIVEVEVIEVVLVVDIAPGVVDVVKVVIVEFGNSKEPDFEQAIQSLLLTTMYSPLHLHFVKFLGQTNKLESIEL